MTVFNFSNMQGTKSSEQDNVYVPVAFRQDNSIKPPDNINSRVDNVNSRVDNNYLPGGSNGFIDETGTWNDGSSLYQYQNNETKWNQSIAGQIINSNAYKKYFYNREDVLQEAKIMAKSLDVPENVILKDANTLAKTREIYNYKQRQLDKDEVFKAYPELSRIAEKSDTDAAIALHNLENIRQSKGIVDSWKTGYENYKLNAERGALGFKRVQGNALTSEEEARLKDIEERMQNAKQLPGLFDNPIDSIVGGTAQTLPLMLRGIINGQRMGMIGAGAGAIIGALGGGSATLGVGAAPAAITGARIGYSIGSRVGMAQDMANEIAGNNYLDFIKYRDKNGNQLLTDTQARAYALGAAYIETGIEFSNVDKILEVAKTPANERAIKAIIQAAKNSTEARAMIAAAVKNGLKNIGEVALSESGEEGVQEVSNRIISNIMASYNPGGDIPTYSATDIIKGGAQAMWQAIPASLGLGMAAQGTSTFRIGRELASILSIKNEKEKADYKNASGLTMLRQLKEYMANSKLAKKNPELQKEVLTEQLADSGMETLAVDTDMVLNQEGGYELLKEVANKAGISDEAFNEIVETRSDMTINTAVYAQTILPDELAAKLEDYITFDAAGECIARNRQYAGRIRRLADELLEGEAQKRAETLATFLDSNFRNDQEREVAEAVLMRFPDNPAEGVKEIRKQIQGKIDAMLEPVLERMREGMGNGVSIIYVDDEGNPTTEEYAARGIRASNNETWYSEFFKDYGRAPTKQEQKDIARDILTGRSNYQVLGWEYQPGMEEFYEQNKEELEKLDESIERLNSLAPRLEKIDPGELTITEGLSKEGYEVYKMTAEKLLSSASKQARTAARMSAILYARMADRMAELYREAGYKRYTALDFAKKIKLDVNSEYDNTVMDKITSNVPIYKISDYNTEKNKYIKSKAIEVKENYIQKENDEESIVNAAVRMFKDIYPNGVQVETILGKTTIDKNSIKSSLSHGFNKIKLDSVISLPEGIKQASYLGSMPDLDGKPITNHYFAYKISYSGKEMVVLCRARENEGRPIKLYIHEVFDEETIKNKSESISWRAPEASSPRGVALYINIIKPFLEDVNKTFEQRDYNAIKQAQLDLINQNNVMQDDYHTGIRTIDDILSADEALNVTQEALDNYEVEGYSYPDFSLKDGKKALKAGKIRVYSSRPITPGAFISPSKMMAQDYAGGGRIFSKLIPLEDVAFINGDEGQYAPVSKDMKFGQAAGWLSETANLKALEKAKEMDKQGVAMKDIFKETGWYKGVDNLWRYEIPDNLDRIDASMFPNDKDPVELWKIYDNPELYEAYPWLAELPVYTEELDDEAYKGYAAEDYIVLNKSLLNDSEVEKVTINGKEYTRTVTNNRYKASNYVDAEGNVLDSENEDIELAINLAFGLDTKFNRDKAISEIQDMIKTVSHTIEVIKAKGIDKAVPTLLPQKEKSLENLHKALEFIRTAEVSDKNISIERNVKEAHKALAGTLIHEIQHIIQGYERFAKGGNPDAVNKQIERQLSAFNQKAKDIHPNAYEFYTNYKYYIKKKQEYDLGLITKEELDEIEHWHVKPFEKISSFKRERIKSLYDQYFYLKEQKASTELDNFDKYMNLAGEQEARAATRKAELNTQLEKIKKLAEVTDKEIVDKYMPLVPEKDRAAVRELLALQKKYNDSVNSNTPMPEEEADKNWDRQSEIMDTFPQGHAFWKISMAIFNRESAKVDMKKLQTELDRMALEGVDKLTAIVVFNGDDVGGFNIEGKVVGLKGQTTIKANGERVISLFKAADQSTFMHEAAHLYLSEMIALAKTPNAPARLHKDLETIASWANWSDGQITEYVGTYLEKEFKKLDSEIKEAMAKGSAMHNGQEMTLEQLKTIWMQERFARGFENYLKQGKAPTAAIQSVFSKFKAWLSNIYCSFKQLGGAPTKEVRDIMDRMIATQDEVEIEMKKRGVNDFVKNGGMDYLAEDSLALYNRMVERAKEEAESKVMKIAMKDVRDDMQKQKEEYLAQAEKDYREELSTEPVFNVLEHMKNNPGLSTSAVCESLGITIEEYAAQLKEYGGSLDAAVETYMKELRQDAENNPVDESYIKKKAEEAVQSSYYRKIVTALELNAFENIAKAQRTLNRKIAKELGEVDAKEAAEAMKKLTAKEKMEAGLRAVRDVAEGHYKDYVNYVKSKLETMPISDANNYKMWRRKSQEAADMASHAMTKGNWEQAVNCKKQQLIYDLFADEAVKGAKYVDKLEQTLARRQVTMSNNLNMPADERYVYNHLLFVFGFVKKDAAIPPEYKGFTNTLMKRDETLECPFVGEDGTLDLPDWILSAGSGTQARAAGHSDLTIQQLKDLAQLMKVIYKTGMEADKLRTAKDIHGNTVGLLDAISQIAREAEQRVLLKNSKDITGAQGTTRLEDVLNAANAAHVALLKPETIFRQLGESAMRYIYNPLKAAADKELKLSGEMQKDLTKLFSVYSKEEMHEMRTEKKYRLGTSLLTKERLIMLGLNWGTYISEQRIMAGHNVSSYEVVEALSNLDQRDWELITGIWALYEKHWPELQAVEARLTGAVLEKQEAFPFTVLGKDGTKYNIPGGYFPLKYDASKNASVAERAEDVAKQATMAGFALGIGRSMTKERSKGRVALPLDLRFDIISKTLADEIHLISFREPVRDARRIILNDEFTAIVQGIYGISTVSMLRKWSADCWALEPAPQTGFEKVMSMLRGNMTMAVLGYRTMTAILNVLNLAPMAHYLGGPAEAMRAMKRFYANPRKLYAYITQESVFMAERAQTMDVNIREAIQKGTTADMLPGYKVVQENAFRIIAMTDLSIAMPLWLREYEKAYQESLDNGLKPESAKRDAVLAGDAAVRRVFGSSQKIDLAAVQRGSEVMKSLTMYYTYFSTLYNALAYMTYETRQKVMRVKIKSGSWKKAVAENKKQLLKGLGPLANGLLMWILIPSIMEALLRPIADDDKDKWDLDKIALKSAKNVVSNFVGGIPVLRDAVPYLLAKAFDEPQYSLGTLPAYNTVEQLNKVIQSIASDKRTMFDVARESLRLTSTMVGFSNTLSDALATTIEWAGTDFEASIPEYLRAVVFDRKLKKK